MILARAVLLAMELLVFGVLGVAAVLCIVVLTFTAWEVSWEAVIRPIARVAGQAWRTWCAARCRKLLSQPRCPHLRVRELCDECSRPSGICVEP